MVYLFTLQRGLSSELRSSDRQGWLSFRKYFKLKKKKTTKYKLLLSARDCWTAGGALSTGLCDCAQTYPIHSSSLLWGHPKVRRIFWDCFFLSRDTVTEVPYVREDLRVLTVLGSSCPLSGFSPVHYANSMAGAWMYWECAGCGLNFLGTAAPLWAPIQTWVSVQMDSTCITIYSELTCPSMCWPSVFPLHSDF